MSSEVRGWRVRAALMALFALWFVFGAPTAPILPEVGAGNPEVRAWASASADAWQRASLWALLLRVGVMGAWLLVAALAWRARYAATLGLVGVMLLDFVAVQMLFTSAIGPIIDTATVLPPEPSVEPVMMALAENLGDRAYHGQLAILWSAVFSAMGAWSWGRQWLRART